MNGEPCKKTVLTHAKTKPNETLVYGLFRRPAEKGIGSMLFTVNLDLHWQHCWSTPLRRTYTHTLAHRHASGWYPPRNRMLYSYTHMAAVGVKGLTRLWRSGCSIAILWWSLVSPQCRRSSRKGGHRGEIEVVSTRTAGRQQASIERWRKTKRYYGARHSVVEWCDVKPLTTETLVDRPTTHNP